MAARTCSRDRSPRGWRSPSFRRWKTPGDGTIARRTKLLRSIDLKVPPIAASSLRAFSLERQLRFSQQTLDAGTLVRRPSRTKMRIDETAILPRKEVTREQLHRVGFDWRRLAAFGR